MNVSSIDERLITTVLEEEGVTALLLLPLTLPVADCFVVEEEDSVGPDVVVAVAPNTFLLDDDLFAFFPLVVERGANM